MFGMLLRKALADHEAQEATIRTSDLDWVIVRPAAFSDQPATGDYWHGVTQPAEPLRLKISRTDVADFMLQNLSDNRYLRQAPGLSDTYCQDVQAIAS